MPVILMKHKILLIIIFTFLLLSIICQIIMGVIYRRLLREASNMAATENKLLKQCKLKYANCYKLNGRVVNTSVFVDKYIQRMKYARLPLKRMPHIAGQLMMLSVLTTGITICLCLAAGDTLFQIIPYYIISILGLYLYFSISGIVDVQGQKTALKMELVDYLENHMLPKLEREKEMEAAGTGEESASQEFTGGKIRAEGKEEKRDFKQENLLSEGYQEELENLLKELLA